MLHSKVLLNSFIDRCKPFLRQLKTILGDLESQRERFKYEMTIRQCTCSTINPQILRTFKSSLGLQGCRRFLTNAHKWLSQVGVLRVNCSKSIQPKSHSLFMKAEIPTSDQHAKREGNPALPRWGDAALSNTRCSLTCAPAISY